jgi:hypothetical protein
LLSLKNKNVQHLDTYGYWYILSLEGEEGVGVQGRVVGQRLKSQGQGQVKLCGCDAGQIIGS